jgi:hypothetical protein
MRLLQHRAQVEHAVEIGVLWCDAPQDGIGRRARCAHSA